MKLVLFFLSIINAFSANALTVDTMFLVSDSNGNGVVTLTNDFDQPSFIRVSISEIRMNNSGEIVRAPYTKDNIEQWQLMTTAPRVILEPGRTKDIGIRSLCNKVKCDRDRDLNFSVVFEPTPYLKDGQEQDSAVQVNYGYSVIYVVPATKSEMKYDITRNGRTIKIFNRGNTMMTLLVDQCKSNKNQDCRFQVRALAGRLINFTLPEHMEASKLEATIYNHDESYKHNVILESDVML